MTGGEAEKQEEGGGRLCLQVQASSGWPTSSSQTLSPNSPFSVTTSDESIHEEASTHVLRLPLHNRASSEPPHRSPRDTITGGSLRAGGKPLSLSLSPSLPLSPPTPSCSHHHPLILLPSHSEGQGSLSPPVMPVFLCVLHTGLPPTQELICPLPWASSPSTPCPSPFRSLLGESESHSFKAHKRGLGGKSLFPL